MKTKVIFRTWHTNGEVIALFPEVPEDAYGHHCTSYERVGQHGGASIDTVMLLSDPATPEEYADLKRELEERGYDLEVRQKVTAAMNRERRARANQFLTGGPG